MRPKVDDGGSHAPFETRPTLVDRRRSRTQTPSTSPTLVARTVERAANPDEPWRDAFSNRYESKERLGEGGMGEVHLFADLWIGRDVAMKTIHSAHVPRADLQARFLREVRVQGQLEHPSIVPVYDIGREPSGASFFTMKRIRGVTFADVVARLRTGDDAARREFSRFRLLTALVSVCQAIDYAHSRGVVHRDLKPGNIMLGDFGEVYVLDWGLAKVDHFADPAAPVASVGDGAAGGLTAYGAIMGTAGYMAPEQARADGDSVGPWSDVYSLGAILFELLTLESLHEPKSTAAILHSTLRGVDVRSAMLEAGMDIPPELIEICAKATEIEPRSRFASVREMQAAFMRFLEGDRDLERRRELAKKLAADAHAVERAVRAGDESAERSHALATVGRALALDPENQEARQTLLRLLTDPPAKLPADARNELESIERRSQRLGARLGAWGYAALIVLYGAIALSLGPHSMWRTWILVGLWGVAAANSLWVARRRRGQGHASYVTLVVTNVAVACSAWIFGPFVVVPSLAAVTTLNVVLGTAPSRRWLAVALGCLAIVTPAVMGVTGLAPLAHLSSQGGTALAPSIGAAAGTPTLVIIVLMHVVFLVVASLFVATFRDQLTKLETALFLQTWQLRQLVPAATGGAMRTRSNPSR
jgi:serine/threonine-protein kinase